MGDSVEGGVVDVDEPETSLSHISSQFKGILMDIQKELDGHSAPTDPSNLLPNPKYNHHQSDGEVNT